jgi:hypothetical protein
VEKRVEHVISRVRAEFVEMPGLRLTVPQAMRLWGLERDECQRVVDALLQSAFLQLTPKGEVIKA